jgi:hypothetical protein
MHKNATKCNETLRKWCKNKHGASKIIDTFETYQKATPTPRPSPDPIGSKLSPEKLAPRWTKSKNTPQQRLQEENDDHRRRHRWPAKAGLSFRPELLDNHLTQIGQSQPMPPLNRTPRHGDCPNTTSGPPPTSRSRFGRPDPATTHRCDAIPSEQGRWTAIPPYLVVRAAEKT